MFSIFQAQEMWLIISFAFIDINHRNGLSVNDLNTRFHRSVFLRKLIVIATTTDFNLIAIKLKTENSK